MMRSPLEVDARLDGRTLNMIAPIVVQVCDGGYGEGVMKIMMGAIAALRQVFEELPVRID